MIIRSKATPAHLLSFSLIREIIDTATPSIGEIIRINIPVQRTRSPMPTDSKARPRAMTNIPTAAPHHRAFEVERFRLKTIPPHP